MSLPIAPISAAERSFILTGLSHPTHPTRSDGRQLLSPLPIQISYGEAPQASGSARVCIGSTEVLAGIRLEVEDIPLESKKDAWRGRVEVDVTPQAYPNLGTSDLSRLANSYAALISDHFMPSVKALPILPPTKYFIPYLHLTLLSSSSACIPTALISAARAAFCDLRIPITKRIGWEGVEGDVGAEVEKDLSGIKAAVRAGRGGKGKSRAVGRGGEEWDLAGGEIFLEGREDLPVLVVLNLIPNSQAVFLDATPQEEAACPDRLFLYFKRSGKLCGMRTEGTTGLDLDRIRPLLLEGKRIAMELINSLNAQMPI
ncbi:hypothetical protein M231_07573 [Tremella mesenterica]|uniref:Ribosomal RNA-processing protein 42 n=1 Tax=Tremella mesenterica TaxID=5217 RepID=A0A4Q1BFJ2_TREME|nr:hypothetical protein M231_07573 [Tremella mesenterica]